MKLMDILANAYRRKPKLKTLTHSHTLPHNRLAVGHMPAVGRGNPFSKGVKVPHSFAAFLCPSFRPAASRAYSVMAGCFGQSLRLAAPLRGISTPLQPVAHAVESMNGGYSILSKGLPA